MTSALERERLDHQKTREEFQRLKDEHAEDIRIHSIGVEFRRGKRTGNKWLAFCPKCHMPAERIGVPGIGRAVACSAKCGWQVWTEAKIEDISSEIEA